MSYAGKTPAVGAGTCSVSHSTGSKTVNLSTEGTLDWFLPGGSYAQSYRGSVGYSKKVGLGGRIHQSFEFIPTSSAVTFTQACTHTLTTNASDSIYGTALSPTNDQGMYIAGGSVGGYRLRAPGGTGLRNLRVYGSLWSCESLVTVHSTLGAFNDVTYSVNSSAGDFLGFTILVAFRTIYPGEEIVFTHEMTTNLGSTPNLKFSAATLS